MNKSDIAAARAALLEVVTVAVKRHGKSQRDIAASLEVTGSYLGDLLSGRRLFTPHVIDALHRVLKERAPVDGWRALGARARGWDV